MMYVVGGKDFGDIGCIVIVIVCCCFGIVVVVFFDVEGFEKVVDWIGEVYGEEDEIGW